MFPSPLIPTLYALDPLMLCVPSAYGAEEGHMPLLSWIMLLFLNRDLGREQLWVTSPQLRGDSGKFCVVREERENQEEMNESSLACLGLV